jgi:cyanoexosortase A
MTANLASFILSTLRFHVSQQELYIILPVGAVRVDGGCSGSNQIFQLFKISLLVLVLFPTNLTKRIWSKIIVPIIAMFIAFIVNGFRVALLAALANPTSLKAFNYWHLGEGAHVFSMASILIFCLFYYCLLIYETADKVNAS